MALILNLSPELERRLVQAANRQGLPADQFTVQLLEKQFMTPEERRHGAIKLLQSFMEEDEEEQKETMDFLIQALDEDRPSDRKLFPPELKGISW